MGNKIINGSVSLLGALFIVLFILKITNTINWSWWLITLPLWLWPALIVSISLFLVILFAIALIALLFRKR
jgi:hypothetical protein